MPSKPRRVLLVEGREDREVIYQFCNYHQFDNRRLFEIEAKGSYEQLRDDLSVRPRTGIEVIGAVVDADTDLPQRWQSLREALDQSGYAHLPTTPAEAGTIIEPGSDLLPRAGIWLMPDNRLTGMMEDFLQRLVRKGDSLLPRAYQSVDGIPLPERRFQQVHHSKAVIHTWLAWQEVPGTSLGHALTRHYLDANDVLASRFLEWLKSLFR